MEVSQIAQLDTHAVIGGGKAEAFGMDDSAELYSLLSDKIYRDKMRAAMRETICNADDAHKMVGKTDVPIEIVVTNTEIVIKDAGPGIPDHLMHPIYCIYGKSTKVKDANQTGGFGLGSKAPFAVTDHFNVVNHHAGFKTVYAISRGGAATDGKPDMRPMVRVPSDQTGITVTIPIRDPKNRYLFEAHIRAVVKQGGILANLNGVPLERYDYTEARKTEYCVVPAGDLTESKVYVLYGAVMYPLTTTDTSLMRLADKVLRNTGNHSLLVLIAPPNSVGVTPSRESLSYSDQTTETVKRLLRKAKKQLTNAIPGAGKRFLEAWVKKQGRDALDLHIPNAQYAPGLLSTPDMIADHAVSCHPSLHIRDTRRRICKIAGKMFKDDRRFYRRAMATYDHSADYTFRRTAMPVLRIASKMGLLKDLMLFDVFRYMRELPGAKTKRMSEFQRTGHVENILCVARNLRDLRPTLSGARHQVAGFSRYFDKENNYIPGVVLRQWTDKNLKALRELCEHHKIKLELFDYEEAKRNRAPVKRVKTDDKYTVLEDFDPDRQRYKTEATCSEPGFYLLTWQRDEQPRTPFKSHLRWKLAKRYPNTVLITTKQQEDKLKKLGVRNLAEVAAERLVELSKIREVIYGETIRHNRLVKDGSEIWHGTLIEMVLSLTTMDMRIAKLLIPDKATPGEAHAEAALLWDFLTEINSMSKETTEIVRVALFGLKNTCAVTFPHVSKEALAKRFEYLEVLRGSKIIGSSNYNPRSKLAEDLIETIKFLQRRNSQSKFTDQDNTTVPVKKAHKEAA